MSSPCTVAEVRLDVSMWKCTASGQQFEGARKAGTDANGAKIAVVAGENTINVAAFGHSRYHPVNEPEAQIFELRIQLLRTCDVGREGEFIFVTRGRVKDLRRSAGASLCAPLAGNSPPPRGRVLAR